MTARYVNMPLFTESFYTYTISLETISYSVEIVYNERMKLWLLSLYLEDKTPVFEGLGIVPGYPIALDYALNTLTGYFYLECVASIDTEQYIQYPDKLSQYYKFYYIYEG